MDHTDIQVGGLVGLDKQTIKRCLDNYTNRHGVRGLHDETDQNQLPVCGQ